MHVKDNIVLVVISYMITNTGMYWLFVKYQAFSIKDGGGLAATAKFINSAEEASIASSSPLLRQEHPENSS